MPPKMPPKPKIKPRIAANGYRLCDPFTAGQVLIDSNNKQWVLGKTIGMGGFGEIYLCRRSGDKADQYVCKVDNYDGPLFAEMNFYIRVAKEDSIGAFKASQRLKYLGMPRYVANGIHDMTSPAGAHNKLNKETAREWKSQAKANRNAPTLQYRFLVMQRFGPELAAAVKKRLTATDAAHIGAKMIDVLHYIHTFGYIHADIKGTNILQALATVSKGKTTASNSSDYYLVDYGLAERYSDLNGKHKDEVPDRKRANNGTVEYRSRDAHIGLISRRSDVECLAYNVIEWLSGRLPWMDCLANAAKVETMKRDGMKNVDKLLRQCFAGHTVPTGLKEFMQEVNKIGYKSEPNYALLKRILTEKVAKSRPIAANKRAANDDNDDEESDEEEDRESDGEDDDEEEVEEERPRRGNRRVGPTNTRAVNKSPPKRKRPATKTTAAKKRISVVELSDSSPECSAGGRAKGKSPAKKLRVVATNTKSDNHLDPKTPKNKNGRELSRYSTPLMFSRKEDSYGNIITDSDHSPDRTQDDSQLNGSVASSGGRRGGRKTSYYSPMGGSLSDMETSRRESPIMVKTATAPIVTAVVVETEAMRTVRQKLNIKAQQVLAPPIQTETPQMKEIREMRERKALEATKKTTKKRKC